MGLSVPYILIRRFCVCEFCYARHLPVTPKPTLLALAQSLSRVSHEGVQCHWVQQGDTPPLCFSSHCKPVSFLQSTECQVFLRFVCFLFFVLVLVCFLFFVILLPKLPPKMVLNVGMWVVQKTCVSDELPSGMRQ